MQARRDVVLVAELALERVHLSDDALGRIHDLGTALRDGNAALAAIENAESQLVFNLAQCFVQGAL